MIDKKKVKKIGLAGILLLKAQNAFIAFLGLLLFRKR